VSLTVAQDRNYDQSVFSDTENYLRQQPRTPFVHLTNERLFRRHQFSVLLGGLLQHRAIGQDGRSPSLAMFFGDGFTDEKQVEFLAESEAYFSTVEGKKRLLEAQGIGEDLSESLRVSDLTLIQEFMEQLEECTLWYADRWRYYRERFQETAGDVNLAKQNHFWAIQIQKWQEQLLIQHFPRLGFLPTYSFPVDSVQLEVLSGDKQNQQRPWEGDILLLRDARFGISEYAPGAQVIAGGRVWESYGIGQYPKHFMPTRYYRECPECHNVEVAEDRTDFESVCQKCTAAVVSTASRAFIEPKSFVTSSDKPNGQDPGLTRMRAPQAQEARLLSAAEETQFLLHPTNVARTSWSWQDAKQGRMFVVNKGRGNGFIRCSCGYTKLLRKPLDDKKEKASAHRTPFNMPCTKPVWHKEDLAHEFRTDVLQVRLDLVLSLPENLLVDDIEEWFDRFSRTLAEAIKRGATNLLGIESRELAATVRMRQFGYPEVILFDTVAGGAGYCRMLVDRHSMRELLNATSTALDCPAGCTHACRVCLQEYENQRVWDKLDRQPVLEWLNQVLGLRQSPNPYEMFEAAAVEVQEGTPLFLAELDKANSATVVAPSLFNLQTESGEQNGFLAPTITNTLRKIVAWMTAANGRRLEIALANNPIFSPDVPGSLAIWHELQPRIAEGSLIFYRLPRGFDPGSWPRFLTNPGQLTSRTWFSTLGPSTAFLDNPLPTPIWKGPGLNGGSLAKLKSDWQEIKIVGPAKPENITLAEYRADQPRDFTRDFAFCGERSFALLRIEDPYLLQGEWQFRALQRLLDGLSRVWQSWPQKLEIKTRKELTGDQANFINDLRVALNTHGTVVDVRTVPKSGPQRVDFHDRRIVFQPDTVSSRNRITILLTGGVDRYMDKKYECGIIIHKAG
jgi:hypothetical protein